MTPASPQTPSPPTPTNPINYCALPRRLMAMLYDGFILLGLLMLASALALPIGDPEKIAFRDLWFTVWLLIVCFIYLAGCWRFAGMTVGMRAWRIKLIDADGGDISWLRCSLRFIAGFASLGAFGLGLIWSLFDRKNRCWHDLAGHTLLIKSQPKTKA